LFTQIARLAPFLLVFAGIAVLSTAVVADSRPLSAPVWWSTALLLAASLLWWKSGRRAATAPSPAEPRPEPALSGIQALTEYAVINTDASGNIRFFNAGAERLFRIRASAALGQPITGCLPAELQQQCRRAQDASPAPRLVLATRGDGSTLPVEVCVTRLAERDALACTILARDASDGRQDQEHLRLSAKVFESSADGIVITNGHGRVLSANRMFVSLTGYGLDEIIARQPWEFSRLPHDAGFYADIRQTLRDQGSWEGEIWDRHKNGSVLALRVKIRALRNDQQEITHYISTLTDLTASRMLEHGLGRPALTDALTGLPNRTAFQERLRLAMAEAQANQRLLATVFLDLDRFQFINDSLEHIAGDQLLKIMATRLRQAIRENDLVARLGDDEFAIILNGLMTEQDATQVAEKLLKTIAAPVDLDGHELHVTASLGISLYPMDGDSVQGLMKNADTAMHRAKDRGRNRFELYTATMNAETFERFVLANSLRRAIELDQLELYYQPKVDFQTGQIRGLEALIRWNHPDYGQVPPLQFIPLAEETNLIIPLGEWVLTTACQQHCDWIDQGLPPIPIALNLSARQFREKNLADVVAQVLQRTGMNPHYLEFELTESSVMDEPEASAEMLRRLRAMGTVVSIDDFGTGYSSLGYLRRFPINTLKIDRSFIRELETDPDSLSIIQAIVSMARSMNLRTVAEGVETVEQLQSLRRLRCDEMQGYLFSPPLPAGQITGFLRQWLTLLNPPNTSAPSLDQALGRLREQRAG
jgi:diguanylate cyclase (GGDEF)-like protein/PAS domain S-box-containing protein